MHTVPIVLLLLAAVTVLAVAARKVHWPYPAVMVLGGLAISLLPQLPTIALAPDVFFTLFLPPLLYAAAWQTSWREFYANLRPICLLAIGFVVFTTVTIGWLAHLVVPGMPWAAAMALGAIVSPPDAVAVTAIAGHVGLPRRVVAILEGESLVNDASGLTLYRLAVAAAVSGTFSFSSAAAYAFLAITMGIVVGLALGWIVIRLHLLLEEPLVETVITLLTPYAGFLAAEACHGSGVLAVVAMGLYVSRHSAKIFSPATRLQADTVWDTTVFVLNGLVFVLVGLQLPGIRAQMHVGGVSAHQWIEWAIGLCVVMIVVRFVWVFPASYIPRLASRKLRARDPIPPWQSTFIVAYTGMRGADSLAAALALPLTIAGGAQFPRRDLIIQLTFVAILATVVLQTLTLPSLIRMLKLHEDGDGQCEEWDARLRTARAALEQIDRLEAASKGDADVADALRRLRARDEQRVSRLEPLSAGEGDDCRLAQAGQIELFQQVLSAERSTIVDLRNKGTVSDEVLRRVLRDLDLDALHFRSDVD